MSEEIERLTQTLLEAFEEIKRQWQEICEMLSAEVESISKALKELRFFEREPIEKTPYFFKTTPWIHDKRPHKQHRIRNNCRKER